MNTNLLGKQIFLNNLYNRCDIFHVASNLFFNLNQNLIKHDQFLSIWMYKFKSKHFLKLNMPNGSLFHTIFELNQFSIKELINDLNSDVEINETTSESLFIDDSTFQIFIGCVEIKENLYFVMFDPDSYFFIFIENNLFLNYLNNNLFNSNQKLYDHEYLKNKIENMDFNDIDVVILKMKDF